MAGCSLTGRKFLYVLGKNRKQHERHETLMSHFFWLDFCAGERQKRERLRIGEKMRERERDSARLLGKTKNGATNTYAQ
jgi:hypothetical protein